MAPTPIGAISRRSSRKFWSSSDPSAARVPAAPQGAVVIPAPPESRQREYAAGSRAALALLPSLPAGEADDPAFGLSSATLDALFRRARIKAGITDLHFHDTRHEAITRLARKLDVLDLARMIGHRALRSLQVYYNPTPAEIAARLY